MMMMDDPKVGDALSEPVSKNHLRSSVYKSREWIYFDVYLVESEVWLENLKL